jgi:hypothetical protein
MTHGDHQEVIFGDDDDRNLFLAILAESCEKSVCDYVHLNPVRAGLLRPEQPVEANRWSSYPLYPAERASVQAPVGYQAASGATVTVGWIAQGLNMGTRGHPAHLLYRDAQARSHPPESGQPQLNI